MASNRKTRRFEGTCYIPGEQLAIMAKYYRGANLNLNLTLVEDDMEIMKESLENSCWCSKLDEVDRMKLQHMKGNAWRIQHDHHQESSDVGGRGSGNCCFPPVKFSGMEGRPETRVDKGTDTVSLYNQSPRRDYHDTSPNTWESAHPLRGSNYNGDRQSYRKGSPRRGFVHSQDVEFQRPHHNPYLYPVRHSPSQHDDSPSYRNDRRNGDHEVEDEMSSIWTLEKSDDDIKCVVCKKDVCAVCKNPLRGKPCHCKCARPNAALCNECDMQCEKESDKEGSVSRSHEQTQTNWSNLMFLMMSSQMFNRSPNNETFCKCSLRKSKPVSMCDSESASGSSSCSCCTEKVQKIYVYDCESPEKFKNKEGKKSIKNKMKSTTTTEGSSVSSSNCDCCKCTKKDKKPESPDTHKNSSSFEMKRVPAKYAQPSSRRHTSTEDSDKPVKHAKSPVTSSKEHHSAAGNKVGDKHASFSQPLEASNFKKEKTKKNKQRKVEDPTDDDTKSQSSVQSDRIIIDRKKSSQSSLVDLNDFLVFLPKIKSDLEHLLIRLEQEGRESYNHEKVPHLSMPMLQPYFTNVRSRSNVPFITHPAACAPLSSRPLSQETCPPSTFHPNLDYRLLQNQNIPPGNLGEFNIYNHSIPIQENHDTIHPRGEKYHCIFPSIRSNKVGSGTSTMSYGHGLNSLLSNVYSPNTGEDLWKRNEINDPDTSRDQTNLHNYNNKRARDSLNHGLLVNHNSLSPKKPSSPVMKNSKITNSKTDMTNEGATKPLEDYHKMKVEGNSPSTTGSCNDIATIKDLINFKAKPLNEPMQSVKSYDSKHTSDQFMSAAEGNEHFSEEVSTLESEHKPVFSIPGQQVSNEFIGNKTTQSIGPGQFRVSTFSSLDFKLPDGPSKKNHRSHNFNKRKRYLDGEGASEVRPKEDQINSHRAVVENCSLALKHPSLGSQELIKLRGRSLDVNVSDEKASRNFNSHEDRLKIIVQPHESLIALSETHVKTSDSHNILLSNMEVRTISPALKKDAEFYSMIDQMESTSAAEDVSIDSLQCGIAHSSLPSSEEDVNLPKLPTESKELVCGNEGKERCSHGGQHKSNYYEKYIGKDITGGMQHRKNIQMAKFQLAQEAIQSMVQNMNEVLASIDSDSESKITATLSSHGGRERHPLFMHLERDETVNERRQERAISKYQNKPCTSKTDSCRFNPRQFDAELHAEPPQSLQSFSSNELRSRESSSLRSTSQGGGELETVSRERNYFLLDSGGSNSSVFTEKLRQSLANETSSPNLSAVLTPEEYAGSDNLKRTSSPKPLKRRSWVRPSK